jgi:hypothetical protein
MMHFKPMVPGLLALAATLVPAVPAAAQFKNGNQTILLELPRVSPRAVATQRIGLTDISVIYHRPSANGRKVFGDVVSYGRVWRAGANDNTTIEFTDPIRIEGQLLPAGKYGVHMIPGQAEWTVIFSHNTTSWGSFSYTPKEDALRVHVKPQTVASRDLLSYEFSNLTQESATLSLIWATTQVRLSLTVDTKNITLASLRRQLRHLAGYKGEAFYDAALYCVDNEFNYDEALSWIDSAIAIEDERYENLELKSQILERLGRTSEAAATLAAALKMARPEQMFDYGNRLLREKKVADARTLFERVTRDHPDAWINWYGLAKVQAAEGNREAARRTLEESTKYAVTAQQKANLKFLLGRLAAGLSLP